MHGVNSPHLPELTIKAVILAFFKISLKNARLFIAFIEINCLNSFSKLGDGSDCGCQLCPGFFKAKLKTYLEWTSVWDVK